MAAEYIRTALQSIEPEDLSNLLRAKILKLHSIEVAEDEYEAAHHLEEELDSVPLMQVIGRRIIDHLDDSLRRQLELEETENEVQGYENENELSLEDKFEQIGAMLRFGVLLPSLAVSSMADSKLTAALNKIDEEDAERVVEAFCETVFETEEDASRGQVLDGSEVLLDDYVALANLRGDVAYYAVQQFENFYAQFYAHWSANLTFAALVKVIESETKKLPQTEAEQEQLITDFRAFLDTL